MALLKSISNGNFTSASTWGLCTAVNELSNATVIASTTTYTLQNANAFSSTVNANALGVLLKIGVRSSSSGTVSAALCNNAGTVLAECVMNIADIASSSLPTSGSTSVYGHWVFFKFSTPVPITNGTFYRIAYKTSVNGSLSFHRNSSTTGVHNGAIVTDVTQVPAATDRFIIVGDNNADPTNPGTVAGSKSSITVTMDNTNTTQFGDGLGFTFGQPYWSLYVGDNATLTYGSSPATDYNLRIRGNIGIGAGGTSFPGTISLGTTAVPIPRSSTAKLEIDSATVANAFNFSVQGGVFIAQGLSRTIDKNIDKCLLSSNASAGATSLTVDADTGWLNGDEVYIGQTTRAAGGGAERRTLGADAVDATLSITAGLTASKQGDSTINAPIVLITRNVSLTAVSSALPFYAYVLGASSVVDCDWAQIKWYGSATSSKNGFYFTGTSAANISFNNCCFDTGYIGILSTSSLSGFEINNCSFIANTLNSLAAPSGVAPETVISNTWFIPNSATAGAVSIRELNFTFNNIRIAGSGGAGIVFSTTVLNPMSSPVTWNNFIIHSCNNGISLSVQENDGFFTLNNFEIQRCIGSGIIVSASTCGVKIINGRFWGNVNSNVLAGTSSLFANFIDCAFAGQSGNTTLSGIAVSAPSRIACENCTFGSGFSGAIAHTSQDISFSGAGTGLVLLRSCVLSSSPEVGAIVLDSAFVASVNHDQVTGERRVWSKKGLVSSDTAIVRTGGVSMRMTPNNLTNKLEYVFARTAVNTGTAPLVGIYVRKSVAGDGADYNGSQPRLIVRRNIALGIASDTVIATGVSANGTWELLSGNLPTLTGSGIVEIEVDCDGTAGWINIDDFQSPPAVNTKSFNITDDTLGVVAYGDNSSGGGSLIGPSMLVS